jgi:hypothetical protein
MLLKKILPWSLFTGLWLFALSHLVISPIHGIADNQDFWRVMQPAGICYENKNFFLHVEPNYSICEAKLDKSSTSAVVPAWIAKNIASLFFTKFPLALLGSLYWLFAFIGFLLLARSFPSPWIALPLSWIYLDPNYFFHFNSFFSDAAWIASFPWLLWLLRAPQASRIMLTLPLALFATLSKLQYLLTPALAAISLFRSELKHRQIIGFLLAMGISCLPLLHEDTAIRRMNAYQATFVGAAIASPNPQKTLEKLGVPKDSLDLAGQPVFYAWRMQRYTPELMDYLDEFSRWKLLGVYLSEPESLWKSLLLTQEALAKSSQETYGHFEKNTGRDSQQVRNFWQFSQLRDLLFGFAPWLIWLAPALALVLAWKKTRWESLLLFLSLHFFTQIPIAILGDGFYSTARHLIGARLAGDFLLVFVLIRLKPSASAFADLKHRVSHRLKN